MKRPKIKKLHHKKRHTTPGASPGTLLLSTGGKKPTIRVMCYDGDHFEDREVADPQELRRYLEDPKSVAWIDVRGLGDEMTLREIGHIFKIHPLALEDIVHTPQRPKTEDFDQHQFIIARMVMLHGPDDMEAGQLSMFLGKNYVLTFHDDGPDCLDPVRVRIKKRAGIHRRLGADYLCYSIIDALIDHYFPVLEAYGEYLDQLEEQTVSAPKKRTLSAIHTAKRELMDLRRVLWPQREMLSQLTRDENPFIGPEVRVFLRDCYDHSVQVMDMVENFREIVGGLHDVYLSSLANRTNEVMKMLTVISTIFIPLTFIAGIYGMNFSSNAPDINPNPLNMPELYHPFGYPATLLGMALIGLTLVVYFWRKGWIFEKAEDDSVDGNGHENGNGSGSANGSANGKSATKLHAAGAAPAVVPPIPEAVPHKPPETGALANVPPPVSNAPGSQMILRKPPQ